MRRRKKVTSLLMVVLGAAIILGFIFSLKPSHSGVKRYDVVKLDYQIWASDSRKNYDPLNPLRDHVVLLTVIPITEDPEHGLILGLYNNLISKGVDYESGLIWLDKCVDQDRNGIDDTTGKPALSYGNSTDQYFGMCLMIKFEILDIL